MQICLWPWGFCKNFLSLVLCVQFLYFLRNLRILELYKYLFFFRNQLEWSYLDRHKRLHSLYTLENPEGSPDIDNPTGVYSFLDTTKPIHQVRYQEEVSSSLSIAYSVSLNWGTHISLPCKGSRTGHHFSLSSHLFSVFSSMLKWHRDKLASICINGLSHRK